MFRINRTWNKNIPYGHKWMLVTDTMWGLVLLIFKNDPTGLTNHKKNTRKNKNTHTHTQTHTHTHTQTLAPFIFLKLWEVQVLLPLCLVQFGPVRWLLLKGCSTLLAAAVAAGTRLKELFVDLLWIIIEAELWFFSVCTMATHSHLLHQSQISFCVWDLYVFFPRPTLSCS